MIKGLLDGRWNGAGKGIATYLPTNGPDDLKNARRTVNVTDKWDLIGGYYTAFLSAIKEAGGVPVFAPKPVIPVTVSTDAGKTFPTDGPDYLPASSGSWLAVLIKAIAAVFTRKEA